jgi:outer membrane protein assembly factor BamB
VDIEKGEDVWQMMLENYATAAPTIVDGKVIVGHYTGRVTAADLKTGNELWSYPEEATEFAFHASVAVHNGIVVAAGRDHLAHGISLKDGKPLWTFTTKGEIDATPLITGNRVYIASRDGTLYGLDLKTGEKKWEYESGGAFIGSPMYHQGRLYIGNADGILFCFAPEKASNTK